MESAVVILFFLLKNTFTIFERCLDKSYKVLVYSVWYFSREEKIQYNISLTRFLVLQSLYDVILLF